MWLYRSHTVMVAMVAMVVMVSALTQLVWARDDSQPLLKHFNIYGCQSSSLLYQNINLSYFETKHKLFFIGLGGTSRATKRLQASSSLPLPCKLPPNVLFCALTRTNENLFNVTFHQVVSQDDDQEKNLTKECRFGESHKTADKQLANNTEQLLRNQHDNKQGMENLQQNEVTCSFTLDDRVSLSSGYGFISCPDGSSANQELWRKWQKAVATIEEENARGKAKTVVGVVIGTCVTVFLILICVLCRLRSLYSSPYYSQRRPSNTSGLRTASTHDHPSSRT